MFETDFSNLSDDVTVVEIPTGIKSIWEVAQSNRCPLIGSCLNEEEHKRMLKKSGYQIKGLRLYEVHAHIMKMLHDENKVSVKVDNYLRRKYKTDIDEFGRANEQELRTEWNKRLTNGNFAGLFYLACARRDVSEDLVEEMFGEIHMMSHHGVNAISRIKGEFRESQNTNSRLKDQIKTQKQSYRELKKENQTLRNELSLALKKLESLEKSESSDNQKELEKPLELQDQTELELQLLEQQKEIQQLKTELRTSYKEVETLTELLEENEALNDHLKGDIEELISHFTKLTEVHSKTENTPNQDQDLESKRVLIVGGMTKIKHLYQHMVEMNGGQFEYHDGYLKNGNSNLDAKVSRSDIIICPVNCNSHNACNRLKRLCRKYKKPLKMLPNASVSSISTALFTTEANLNGQLL